jgi:hypothetical protein
MTHSEIFRQAAQAADDATMHQFAGSLESAQPTTNNAAGDYWKLVYEATVAALLKWNGSY